MQIKNTLLEHRNLAAFIIGLVLAKNNRMEPTGPILEIDFTEINTCTGQETKPEKIFYNYIILKNIFQHVDDYENLKQFRSVSSIWNTIASSILYSKSYALLNDPEKLADFITHITLNFNCQIPHVKICDINFMEADLRNLELFWSCPTTDLLVSFEIDLAPCHGKTILANLLNARVFPVLESLKIRILKFYNVTKLEDDDGQDESWNDLHRVANMKERRSNFPRLSSFAYTYYTFDGSDFNFPLRWEIVLEQFYSLQELLLTGISSTELHELLDAIWILRNENPGKFNIETFQVLSEDFQPEAPANEHLQKLTQLNLPLQTLNLEIGPNIDEFLLESTLSHFKHSLSSLQLRKYPNPIYVEQEEEQITSIIFQGLYGLSTLDISDCFMPSLDFLVHLPNLSSLTLSNRNPSKLSETKMISNTSTLFAPVLQLTSLSIDENVSISCFKKLCDLFPNLEQLRLRMDDEMLRITYENLVKLKSLHVIGKFNEDLDEELLCNKVTCSDKGITGIPLRYMVWGNVNLKKNRMFPYIGDLPELENVTIEAWLNYGVGVTNYSIYYGLVELPKLRTVKLARTLVTEEGVEVLTAKGVKVKVIE